ncbi:MAG TPA: metal-sulfur cluster assembly factor [Ktedonobacterales bacterium]|jgi:metal-sulfur cluster biosynthetic enzyme|nr:metal-sulfur cluster assembly factor [Ktedonobacterales bacterium]
MTTEYPSLRTHPAQDPCCPALWDALRDVTDPEIPISLVDLGMIVAVDLRDGVAHITMTLTAMGCPATEYITDDIRARLLKEPGIREVEIEIVWDPVWSKARLSDDGIDAMRAWGISA